MLEYGTYKNTNQSAMETVSFTSDVRCTCGSVMSCAVSIRLDLKLRLVLPQQLFL